MEYIKYSIIIPVFNGSNYIPNFIETLSLNTNVSCEFIFVDDGSTDNTLQILKFYSHLDKRIKVFSKSNGGPSSARNLGLDNSNGTFVLFLDIDDKFSEDLLSEIDKVIGSEDLLLYNFNIIFSNGMKKSVPSISFNELRDKDLLINFLSYHEALGYLWNKVFKRSVIEQNKLRFVEDIKFKEDEEFVVRFLVHTISFSYLDKVLYNYLIPDYSKYEHLSNFKCILRILQTLVLLIRDFDIKQQILTKYKHMLVVELFKVYISQGFVPSYKALVTFRNVDKDNHYALFLDQFNLKKVYFPSFIQLTHIIYYILFKFKARQEHTKFVS